MCCLILNRMTEGELTVYVNIVMWIKAYQIQYFHLHNTLVSMERGVALTVAVDSLSFFISSLRVFRQDAQISKKIKVSFFIRKRRKVSGVKPSL